MSLPGIKDQAYAIAPKMDGKLKLFNFELCADVQDSAGSTVGYWVVELLPGVYNEISIAGVFARVK